jgi:hypothetical protein
MSIHGWFLTIKIPHSRIGKTNGSIDAYLEFSDLPYQQSLYFSFKLLQMVYFLCHILENRDKNKK